MRLISFLICLNLSFIAIAAEKTADFVTNIYIDFVKAFMV